MPILNLSNNPLKQGIILFSILVLLSSCSNDGDYIAISNKTMSYGTGIDKTFFLVKDLQKTRDYFADTLGFSVPKSNRFQKSNYEGVMTTRVRFPDMSSFHFLAVEDSIVSDTTPTEFIDYLSKQEGLFKYSISSSQLDTTRNFLISRGFLMDSIQEYRTSSSKSESWSRDTGGSQERSLNFSPSNNQYLPQFLQQLSGNYKKTQDWWNTYYGYNRSYSNHKNGVVGISSIGLAVDTLEVARKEFQQMGWEERRLDSIENSTQFLIKRNQTVELIAPTSESDDISKFIQSSPTRVYSLRFEVKNIDSTFQFFSNKLPKSAISLDSITERLTIKREYALGVQLEFEQESSEQALLAQQLKIGGKLDSVASNNAERLYLKYCALCHGENREGYAADNAPSLKSHSLLASSKDNNFMRYTIQFGRANTAMGGYLDDRGGPMEFIEIELLLQWLYEQAGVEESIKNLRDPVEGDELVGAKVYKNNCAACHGQEGEGISAPALGNPMLLATATDGFLKYAIKEGRDSTAMIAYKDILSEEEINGVTAFLRSRAAGWNVPKGEPVTIPKPEDYVLNPNGKRPNFKLRENQYVSAAQVAQAMKDSMKMVILDARSKVAWKQMHIPGSFPVPYYEEPEAFINDIPNDDTWVVVYCACPHAASQRVVNTLKRYGFKNTAIIDEGVLVWAQMGFPVRHGQ